MEKEIIFKKIKYKELNSRQKENYNFQKVSAVLADYGYTTIRLTDDYKGADFIAAHIDGTTFLKIQLKSGGLQFYKKYQDKDIWVCFPYKEDWFLYPHDTLFEELVSINNFHRTKSWREGGMYYFSKPSREIMKILEKYKLKA